MMSEERVKKAPTVKKTENLCPVYKKCGGCQFQGMPYEEQLK